MTSAWRVEQKQTIQRMSPQATDMAMWRALVNSVSNVVTLE